MLDTKFDVICLSEIWSCNLEFYKDIFPGYIAHFQSPTDTHVGGVALFIKNENKTTERKDLKIVNSDAVKVEDLWFEVTNTDDEAFLISVIYRHPKGNVNHFSDSIENSITKIIDDRKITDCIIFGDMNIDLIKYDVLQSTAEFLSTMLMFQTNKGSSQIRAAIPYLTDQIRAKVSLTLICSGLPLFD